MAIETLRFPGGFVDTHVHLREPGATQKEDFESGTRSALAGGIVTVGDMPNNPTPTFSLERLEEKEKLARDRSHTDIFFYYGSTGDNLSTFTDASRKARALKLYCDNTTGGYIVEDENKIRSILDKWPHDKVAVVHAEGNTLKKVIKISEEIKRKVHVAHISLAEELQMVTEAKGRGLDITCEVTPHHLLLNKHHAEIMKPGYGRMKPPLAEEDDRLYLLNHIDEIDVLATDHAPHTKEEKKSFEEGKGPYGVPGVETSLVLALQLYSEGKLTMEHLVEMMDTNPRRIFNIGRDDNTEVVVEMGKPSQIDAKKLHSKAGWSPFDCMPVISRVTQVTIRGVLAYDNGKFVAPPQGKII